VPKNHPDCLSPPLREQLLALQAGAEADRRWPFLVTLRPGADAAAVLPVAPDHLVALVHLAAARMTAPQVLTLAEDAAVESIEADGVADAIARAARRS
jgi:hypothetical protein